MKIIDRQAPQGDVLFTLVTAIPAGAKPVELSGNQVIVAHSETGHHHVAEARRAGCDTALPVAEHVVLFQDPMTPLVVYLQVKGRAVVDMVHLRDFDTHETLRLDAGPPDSIWEIRRQREYDPAQERRVQD